MAASVFSAIWLILAVVLIMRSQHAGVDGKDANVGDMQCFGTLGCFKWTKDFFHPDARSTNKEIQSRKEVNTRFHLYTKQNTYASQCLKADDVKSIQLSLFNKCDPTVFIIHGFLGSCEEGEFPQKIKDKLLNIKNYNVILVDWRDGCNRLLKYSQAVSNTILVGAEIAYLISKFKEIYNYTADNVYLIGHSLGAQVAGYAGKRLQTTYNLTPGRISALDPAGPRFTQMPITVKVYKTDADFVDVIHTDIDAKIISLGLPEAVGHIDFYPEGGNVQPGCFAYADESGGNVQPGCYAYADESESIEVNATLRGFVSSFLSCSHRRAHEFFANSINPKGAVPVAYRCRNWETFKSGGCGSCGSDISDCSMVGYRARDTYKKTSKTDSFYITTGSSKPYWIYLYQVTVEINQKSQRQPAGKLNLKVKESDKKFAQIMIPIGNIEPGVKYRALVTRQFQALQIGEIEFSWGNFVSHADHFTPTFPKKGELKVDKISFLSMTVIDLQSQPRGIKNYCTPKPVPIFTTVKFTSCE